MFALLNRETEARVEQQLSEETEGEGEDNRGLENCVVEAR